MVDREVFEAQRVLNGGNPTRRPIHQFYLSTSPDHDDDARFLSSFGTSNSISSGITNTNSNVSPKEVSPKEPLTPLVKTPSKTKTPPIRISLNLEKQNLAKRNRRSSDAKTTPTQSGNAMLARNASPRWGNTSTSVGGTTSLGDSCDKSRTKKPDASKADDRVRRGDSQWSLNSSVCSSRASVYQIKYNPREGRVSTISYVVNDEDPLNPETVEKRMRELHFETQESNEKVANPFKPEFVGRIDDMGRTFDTSLDVIKQFEDSPNLGDRNGNNEDEVYQNGSRVKTGNTGIIGATKDIERREGKDQSEETTALLKNQDVVVQVEEHMGPLDGLIFRATMKKCTAKKLFTSPWFCIPVAAVILMVIPLLFSWDQTGILGAYKGLDGWGAWILHILLCASMIGGVALSFNSTLNDEMKEQVGILKNQISVLHDENFKFETNNTRLEGNVAEMALEVVHLKQIGESLQTTNDILAVESGKFAKENADLRDQITELTEIQQDLRANVKELEHSRSELESSVGNLKTNITELECTRIGLVSNNEELTGSIMQLQSHIGFLKNMQSSLTTHLMEVATPEMAKEFSDRVEKALGDEKFFAKLVQPMEQEREKFEETREKYDRTVEQLEKLKTSSQEFLQNMQKELMEGDAERRDLVGKNQELVGTIQTMLNDLGKVQQLQSMLLGNKEMLSQWVRQNRTDPSDQNTGQRTSVESHRHSSESTELQERVLTLLDEVLQNKKIISDSDVITSAASPKMVPKTEGDRILANSDDAQISAVEEMLGMVSPVASGRRHKAIACFAQALQSMMVDDSISNESVTA